IYGKFDAPDKTHSPYLDHKGKVLLDLEKAAVQVFACFGTLLYHVVIYQGVKRCNYGRRGERIASERGCMGSRYKGGHHVIRRHHRPNGKAVAQRFGKAHNVRRDPEMLIG